MIFDSSTVAVWGFTYVAQGKYLFRVADIIDGRLDNPVEYPWR